MTKMIAVALCLPLWLGAAELRVGRAAVKITPPVGMPMAGYYRVRLATGTHNDLHAKALVIEKDGVKTALVACDLVSMPRPIVESARGLIGQTTGVRPDHVMISSTHSHTGPELGARLTGVDDPTMRLAKAYLEGLPGKIAESVRLAEADLKPARVRAGIGREDSVSFIRRFRMKDGSTGWNPGKRNPNIVRPLGSIDPAVPVVAFESADSKPLATYVNFACHLDTVGGLDFSADYPYTLGRLLGEVRGPEMLTLFTIGTAGNINHIDVRSPDPQKGHAEAARIGAILAAAVLKTRLEAVETGPLGARSEIVKLPLAAFGPADVEKAKKVVAAYGTNLFPFLEQVRAFQVLDLERRNGQPLEAEVQVITLGDQLAWVGLPGEIFVELGKAIRTASPFPYTIIAELANGSVGYVPDRKAYVDGAYEVISARCSEGSGEMLVEAAVRLLVEARRRQ